MSKEENSSKTQRLPGEFNLKTIHCGDSKTRGSLAHYYSVGGNSEYGDGVFQARIVKQENGWTLLKNLTVRFTDIDIYYVCHDVVGTEDHVWIYDDAVYKNLHVHDNIEFNAKVYAYRRNPDKHHGQTSIDFSLKELENVKKIKSYSFPPADMEKNEDEWHDCYLEECVCDVLCPYSEHCCHNGICLQPDGWKEDVIQMLKNQEKKLACR